MTKGTHKPHASQSTPFAQRQRAGATESQDHSPALPRTSRFRAHDREGDYIAGRAGASMRHEASRTDSDDLSLS